MSGYCIECKAETCRYVYDTTECVKDVSCETCGCIMTQTLETPQRFSQARHPLSIHYALEDFEGLIRGTGVCWQCDQSGNHMQPITTKITPIGCLRVTKGITQ
jgi:hypothetical protein